MNEQKTLLSIKEVSKLLGVTESWVRSAVFHNKLKYIKVGRLVRFDYNDIENWISSNKLGGL